MSLSFHPLIESCLRNISGGFGRKIRYLYYKKRFGKCGKRVIIDEGVYFSKPIDIFIGDDVWIDKNCILIAGKSNKSECIRQVKKSNFTMHAGEIHIGSSSHLGIGTIIQGHGGVLIDEYFTTSAGCKLYSLSNDYKKCRFGTYGSKVIYYISTPIHIETNVWLGLNVIVMGCTIKSDTFVHANSIVNIDLESNSIAKGSPAIKIQERFK